MEPLRESAAPASLMPEGVRMAPAQADPMASVHLPFYVPLFSLSPQAEQVLRTAVHHRGRATERYRARGKCLDTLEAQVNAGLWRSPELVAAIRSARRDDALVAGLPHVDNFLKANGKRKDLDIRYSFLAPGLSATLPESALADVHAFLRKAAAPEEGTDPWTSALNGEAQAHLLRLWGDWHLERTLAALETAVGELHASASGLDAWDPKALEAHVTAVLLYCDYGLPAQAEEAFDQFRAAYGGDRKHPFPWKARLKGLKLEATREMFVALVDKVARLKKLHNPTDSDRCEIDALDGSVPKPKVALPGLPDQPQFSFHRASARTRQRAREALQRILPAIPDATGRPARVLRAWQALINASLFDFRAAAAASPGLAADDEALGIVTHALLGEAQYHLADYEDAHRALAEAGRLAQEHLVRAAALSPAERSGADGFLARLAQKDGNALFFMGEHELAREAYEQAAGLSGAAPLDAATHLLNLGNLAYLRNNVVDQRGYVTLDWSEMLNLAQGGPRVLQARKVGQHAATLLEAEGHYRAALERVQSVADDVPLRRGLAATAHINLGNTAWAWARVMEAENVARLNELSLGAGWSSELVKPDASRADCYRAAIAQQRQALDAAGEQATTATATAWSNLAELYYLLAEQTQWDATCLQQGLDAAAQVEALVGGKLPGGNAAVLARHNLYLPEAVWRTAHNRARLHEAQGNRQAAGECYEQALQELEAMRRMIRLDTWQATFLQDKLDAYEDYVHFLYHDDPAAHAACIFRLIEMTKARAFLDLVESTRLRVGARADLQTKREELLARISACNEAIRQAIAADQPEKAGALVKQQAKHALAWEDLHSKILAARDKDRDLDPPLVDLPDLQAFLRERNAVCLSFLLGRRFSYLLIADGDAAHIWELASRAEIELAVTRLLWYCQYNSAQSFAQFREANERVVELLLGAAGAQVDLKAMLAAKKVAIAPDGVLFYLPFEVLLVDAAYRTALPATAGYEALRPFYWLAQPGAGPSYVPSASAWMHLAERPLKRSPTSLLGVYNINYDLGGLEPMQWALPILKRLRNLPGAEKTGRILQQFQEAWPGRTVVPVRAWRDNRDPEDPEHQSTEDNFSRLVRAAQPQLILFSGHAVYNDKYPTLSGLIFNLAPVAKGGAVQQGSVGHQDGFLNLEEIFKLEMRRTELAFLAACQSGLGAVYRGEGINALTRALMYRGCPAVVVSLWAVSDRSTEYVARRFFELLLRQPGADRADLLAEAKRELLNQNAPYCLPYYWAPFVLNGVRLPPAD